MIRPKGMHESTFIRYIEACAEAKVNPNRVMQTIGNAKASAGYHAKDGTFVTSSGETREYCAAVDIRSKDLTLSEITNLMRCLAKRLIAPYHRNIGSFKNNQHIHFIDMTLKMKPELKGQVFDFWRGDNGLASHAPDPYWSKSPLSAETLAKAKSAFYTANPKVSGVSENILGEGEGETGELYCCLEELQEDYTVPGED